MPRSKATNTADRSRFPRAPRFSFIGGKGGVGKTTCAAALGIVWASRGLRTLVISTDPAPSLGDALGQPLGPRPRRVRAVHGLYAVEVDARASMAAYLESRRATLEEIALRGTWLDPADVSALLALSLPGIDELAALLQIAALARSGEYERIIVDAAPTGHLLRMLDMPDVLARVAEVFDRMQRKHRIMVQALRGVWSPDRADLLVGEMADDAADLGAMLRDRERARVSWVSLAEAMAVEETTDALASLERHGIAVEALIVNRLTPPPQERCRWCDARRRVEGQAVDLLRRIAGRSIRVVAIRAADREPTGPRALARIGRLLEGQSPASPLRTRAAPLAVVSAAFPELATRTWGADLAPAATRLLIFGGKGGVGKTTCAAAAAVDIALSARERRVLLLSVDPAHSLADVLGTRLADRATRIPGGPSNLQVRELDAGTAFHTLRRRFAAAVEELFARLSGETPGATLTGDDPATMRDLLDLAPPGVDELVAIVEITDALLDRAPPLFDLVVMDTAPTGHALRLLEMPALVHDWVKALMAILLKYQRVAGLGELGALLLRLSQGLNRLRDLITDRERTRFVAVTRAAAVPRAETRRLLRRLTALRVHIPLVIVNAAGAGTCTRCSTDRRAQLREVSALERGLRVTPGRPPLVTAPGRLPPPHGWQSLREWRRTWGAVSPGAAEGASTGRRGARQAAR